MATTTTGSPDTLPYAEDDKLGPIGGKVSALYEPADLRTWLVREFSEAVAAAKAAAASVTGNSATSVHETRKALRRSRAVLEMLAGALPKSERKAVRRALRDARRALSTARDHAVAPGTLGSLPLDEADQATARKVLDNAAEAQPPGAELAQLVGESATRAAAQLEAIQAALPPTIKWSLVVDGVAGVYDDARRARRRAKDSRSWFHTWRRRTKELAYQLQLIAEHAGPRVAAIQAELAAVNESLGPAVDLIMLRDYVTTHSQGITPADLERQVAVIDAQLDDQMKAARKAGADSFEQKARKFAKRLTKAVRRDLTPADDTDVAADSAAD